jgi:hypothetical protein
MLILILPLLDPELAPAAAVVAATVVAVPAAVVAALVVAAAGAVVAEVDGPVVLVLSPQAARSEANTNSIAVSKCNLNFIYSPPDPHRSFSGLLTKTLTSFCLK